jgi:hypothetical protein
MNLLKSFPFWSRYVDVLSRISALEASLEFVLREPLYDDFSSWSFNGQAHRRAIFCELVASLPFQAVIETGTFFGDTTGYMRKRVQCPVFTCEARAVFQAVARSRLREMKGIDFRLGDSRSFLRSLLCHEPTGNLSGPIFFYLDAHWHDDLPLDDEIKVIAGHSGECVIMIDDFEVPNDCDYFYDDYGHGNALCLARFGSLFVNAGFSIFWPSLPGHMEGGGKRGCVVLARGKTTTSILNKVKTLRV